MRLAVAALLLLPAAIAGSSAVAASTPAEWLREACADGDLYYLNGACGGYLLAASDRLALGIEICTEGAIDLFTTIGLTTVDTLLALPPLAGESAEALAERALREALPCP